MTGILLPIRLSGLRRSLKRHLKHAFTRFVSRPLSRLPGAPTFRFRGERYPYFYHPMNRTWRNERAVEIPIVHRELARHASTGLLEVGRVLDNYFCLSHPVVDKQETGPRVHRVDVLDFRPSRRFKLILSVSTLEHVGYDEPDRNPQKPRRTVHHLRSLLCDGGRLVATFPLGFNPHLDRFFAERSLGFDRCYVLQRNGPKNRWKQIHRHEVSNPTYNEPYPGASVVAVGYAERPSGDEACT